MEKNLLKRYKPSTGDKSRYYRETSAVNGLAAYNTSAAMGNLADVMKRGPVIFPNILAPDSFRKILLESMQIIESHELDNQ